MAVLVCTLLSEEISLPSVTYPFRFEDDELGVMFSFSSPWTDEGAQRLARQTSLKLSGQLGCPVGAGIGSIVTSSLNLNESYKIARGSLHSSPNASSDTARVQQQNI